ncbi:MAG: EMC3/TMCO1 family protein [Candidatus Marsarchaeota archaeon]|nr:EMC3/TMCO1 family protein [Candidatus Marsarchaeota archaeon]
MVLGIELTIIAVIYVFFSVGVQRKLVDMKHMQEVQEVIKQKSKELNEMAKNKESQEKLMAKQKEVTSLLGQSMRSQLKPMFVVLPIFFVVYYLVFPAVFPSTLKVTVPLISVTLGYQTYFIAVAFVLGLALSGGLMLRDRLRLAKEKRLAAEVQQ